MAPEKPARNKKLILILSIIIPVVIIGAILGVLAELGAFRKAPPDYLSFDKNNIYRMPDLEEYPSFSFKYADYWTINELNMDGKEYLVSFDHGFDLWEDLHIMDWEFIEYYKSMNAEEKLSMKEIFIENAVGEIDSPDVIEYRDYGEDGSHLIVSNRKGGISKWYFNVIEKEGFVALYRLIGDEDYYDKWGEYLIDSVEERLSVYVDE